MAITFWMGTKTQVLVLIIVTVSVLLFLPSVKCQYCNRDEDALHLQVKISSTLSSNTSTIGPSVNLTCEASQFGRKDSEQTKPSRIEWFLPHNLNPDEKECKASFPVATVLSCTLIVGVLTKEKVGNYTCKASYRDYNCWSTTFQLDFQVAESAALSPTTGKTEKRKGATQGVAESAALSPTTGKTEKRKRTTQGVPEFLPNAQKQQANQENGISGSSKAQSYMLYVISVILVLACCFLLSFWLRRRVHRRRTKSKSPCSVREILPLDKWEILPEQITYEEKLGQGAFGVVYKAHLKKRNGIEVFDNRRKLKPENERQVVAVKMLAVKMLGDDPSDEQKKVFLHEIEQMKLLGSHQNIVSLVGCGTLQEQKFLVIEYVPFGDLLQWLRHRRKLIIGHGTAYEEKKDGYYDDKKTSDDQRELVETIEIEIMEDRAPTEQVPLMVELSPSNDTRDVILDISFSSERIAKDNREHSFGQENIPLVLRPPTPLQNSFTVDMLHYENNEDEGDSFTTQQLFSFAWQIARGMNHLAEKNFVHRDLAARNILVGHDNRVKVSDFGLMRQIYEDVKGNKEKCTKLPVKWMAPESIFRQEFTIKSDTWSYGILLWEMATMGGVPYPTLTNTELCRLLKNSYRMERPDMCCDEVYELMSDCWMEKPSCRPSFSELIDRLEVIMTQDVPYCDLSKHDESRPYYNVPSKYVENSEKKATLHKLKQAV